MSVNALNWVAQHSESKANERLVLFGVADAADKHGRNAWPTLDTLAEFANVDKRTVQRAIQSLEALGELEVERNMGGGSDWQGNRRPNRYALPLMSRGDSADTPNGDTGVVPGSGDTADTPSRSGVTKSAFRGDKLPNSGVTLLSQEQLQNVHIERRAMSPVDIDPDPDLSERVAELRERVIPQREAVGQ